MSDERYVAGVDYDEDDDIEFGDEEPCGEGMCNCHCDGGHVCGCDCWRCDECRQPSEYCFCDEDGEW